MLVFIPFLVPRAKFPSSSAVPPAALHTDLLYQTAGEVA